MPDKAAKTPLHILHFPDPAFPEGSVRKRLRTRNTSGSGRSLERKRFFSFFHASYVVCILQILQMRIIRIWSGAFLPHLAYYGERFRTDDFTYRHGKEIHSLDANHRLARSADVLPGARISPARHFAPFDLSHAGSTSTHCASVPPGARSDGSPGWSLFVNSLGGQRFSRLTPGLSPALFVSAIIYGTLCHVCKGTPTGLGPGDRTAPDSSRAFGTFSRAACVWFRSGRAPHSWLLACLCTSSCRNSARADGVAFKTQAFISSRSGITRFWKSKRKRIIIDAA